MPFVKSYRLSMIIAILLFIVLMILGFLGNFSHASTLLRVEAIG